MDKPDHRTRVAAERRERMRRRLLEAALRLVAEKGPAGTSIDDVIQAAGVSRGSFYKYFDAPDALFEALSLALANEMIAMAEPAVLRLEDPAARVATGMRLVIQLAAADRQVGGFLVRLGWPEIQRRSLMLEFVQRDLALGLRGGRFVAMPMRLALNIVSMTVLGAVDALLVRGTPKDFGARAVASALRALGVPPAEAEQLVALELPVPQPLEGGLVAVRAPRSRSRSALPASPAG